MKVFFIEQTNERTRPRWQAVCWRNVERNVRRLQERIYRATERQDWQRVRSLQKLLVRAMSNKLLAVRRVTQENEGRNTPGVDGKVYNTPEERMELSLGKLGLQGYRPRPVRRTYIPKPGKAEKRPLGIPTQYDRVMQAMVKAALEPEWEARFETNSYGFRPGRNCQDAIMQIFLALSKEGSSAWIWDADISACFDNIAHEPLLEWVPVFDQVIRSWLRAGVVEMGHYTDTETGTPQGGLISPLLANIALHGMEHLFGIEATASRHTTVPARRSGLNKGISVIRYADDFVVLAPSRQVLEEYVIPRLTSFLAERGLTVSATKSRIAHRDEGFNFLGFNIRRYGGKLLIKPQKEKVQRHLGQIREVLKRNKQVTQEHIIQLLNPIITGWTNYYRHWVAKETFVYVQHRIWQMLWHWAKRRHRNKPTAWIRRRYFKREGNRNWVFGNEQATLRNPAAVPIVRYVKVRGHSSPYNPALREYWQQRNQRQVDPQANSRRKRLVLRRQHYCCAHCGIAFLPNEEIHYHHHIPRAQGGTDEMDNLRAVHNHCHHQIHQRHSEKVLKA